MVFIYLFVSTCEVSVVWRVDKVVGQRLVHVVNDVQPLRGYDGVLLSPQVASERLQADLVWKRTEGMRQEYASELHSSKKELG